jgi:hypothetical protein
MFLVLSRHPTIRRRISLLCCRLLYLIVGYGLEDHNPERISWTFERLSIFVCPLSSFTAYEADWLAIPIVHKVERYSTWKVQPDLWEGEEAIAKVRADNILPGDGESVQLLSKLA